MKPEWKKYTGSDEQIAEIEFACSDQNGVVLKLSNGKQSRIFDYDDTCNVVSYSFTHYLICQPHPYADMICQWTRTGQPVWVRYAKVCHFGQTSEYEICNQIATLTPDWNIPGAEYSFTGFKE